jgi:hypothetical protein
MKKTIQVGAGRAAIEISEDFFPYRSFKGRYFSEQHDHIYVRTILIDGEGERFLLMTVELGDFGHIAEWRDRIHAFCGVPQQNIFLSATHNHVAPHVCDDWDQEVVDVEKTKQFGEDTWAAMQMSIAQAQESLRPATVGFGTGTCDININRDYVDRPHTIIGNNPHGLSDKTVAVVKFSQLDGTPIALYVNYAVHGAVLMGATFRDGGMAVSGDLPGYTSRLLEEEYGNGLVALWTSGAAGDQNPRYMAAKDPLNGKFDPEKLKNFQGPQMDDQPNLGSSAYVLVQMQAESLADEVLYVADRIDNDKAAVEVKCAERVFSMPGQQKPGPHNKYNPDFRYNDDAPPVPMRLSLLQCNDILFVCVPGELVCSIGLMIKAALADRTDKVVVVTHTNGSISYMSDTVGFATRSGEAMRTHVSRGWAERVIVDGAIELANQLDRD